MTMTAERRQVINANDRLHWAVKARLVRDLRRQAYWCARAQLKPAGGRSRVVITYGWPSGRLPDSSNLAPTSKAILDGMVDAGVFRDDDPKHVVGPDDRVERGQAGSVSITVRIEDEP